MWNEYVNQHDFYQHQMQIQSSYLQLQYLQHQQMVMMMKSNTMKRSSPRPSHLHISPSSSSSTSSLSHHRSSPKPSSRSIHSPASPSTPSRCEPPKRRQSLGKKLKQAFTMKSDATKMVTEKKPLRVDTSASMTRKGGHQMIRNFPDSPVSSVSSASSRSRHRFDKYQQPSFINSLPSPASSTVSTLSTVSTKKRLMFNPVVEVHETFSSTDYDRRCDTNATCQKLTPALAIKIKEELNDFKLKDMYVHVESRQNTHFFL